MQVAHSGVAVCIPGVEEQGQHELGWINPKASVAG
jgi:hypothetical protein